MRLIDADALAAHFATMQDHVYLMGVLSVIDNTPTIDAVPVVHARWEENRMNYRCTACGADFSDEIAFIYPGEDKLPAYCPNCGAKIDEKEMEE